MRRVHSYCLYCDEEYDDERTLAAKCGPIHLRNAKKISRSMIEQEQWIASKNFEDKYVKGVNERLERGPKETASPFDDIVLKDWKQQYANSHTRVLNEGQVYQCDVKDCNKKFKT
jgi:hypothetical protein